AAGDRVPRRIARRIRNTLQILVDGHAAVLRLASHSACFEVQVVDLRHASSTVNRHVCLNSAGSIPIRCVHEEAIAALLDGLYPSIQMHLNTELACGFDQSADELRIKPLERTRIAVHDLHPGTGTCGDVGELERDVATPAED